MKILTILSLIPALSFVGEQNESELDWLVGCWITPDGSAQEVWVADSEGSLTGFGVAIGGNKLSFYEVLSIRQKGDGSVVYTAHPAGQASTSFTAKEITENGVLFVNADHDYPQEIRYSRESNHLYATVSLLNGVNPRSFNKVSCE